MIITITLTLAVLRTGSPPQWQRHPALKPAPCGSWQSGWLGSSHLCPSFVWGRSRPGGSRHWSSTPWNSRRNKECIYIRQSSNQVIQNFTWPTYLMLSQKPKLSHIVRWVIPMLFSRKQHPEGTMPNLVKVITNYCFPLIWPPKITLHSPIFQKQLHCLPKIDFPINNRIEFPSKHSQGPEKKEP